MAQNNFIDAKQLVDKLTQAFYEHDKAISQSVTKLADLNKQYAKLPSDYTKSLKEIEKSQQQITKTSERLSKVEKEAQKQRLDEIRIAKQREQAFDKYDAQLKREATAKQKSIAQSEKQNRLYNQIAATMNKVAHAIQDLIAKKQIEGGLSKKEEQQLKKLQGEYTRYQNAVLRADAAVGRSQRNVGNYSSAIRGLGMNFRMLASAFGFTSGIYLFANGIKDAFQRVRDFDKSMQNLAGVMRVTREDNEDLEESILTVAGVTVRTSNEVAKLAESLATLGKTKSEIQDLLKPVIDLSLGLDAPADEAGEFLIQMLNAFQKSTDSAAEFADTIATIRTSTTLDFQKMRDSFAYIAPIANLLNKDLAWTGATVGILADNGLKAESAGRLLSTSLIKLATAGKTLPEALEEINKLYADGATELEILTKANSLFGKQSAKIGAILALNTDAIELNAQAIRDNGGALKDLTDRQLESLDAKLKILDSSYERWILSIEKGDGVISKFLISRVEDLTKLFGNLSLAQEDNIGFWDRLKLTANSYGKTLSYMAPIGMLVRNIFEESTDELVRLNSAMGDSTGAIKKQTEEFVKLHGSLAPLTLAQQTVIDNQEKINRLFGGSPNGFSLPEEDVRTLKTINEEIKQYKDNLNEIAVSDIASIRAIQAKIKILEKERDAILGVNKEKEKAKKLEPLKNSIDFYNNLISKLEDVRDRTAMSNSEFKEFNRGIDKLKHQVHLLNGEWARMLRLMAIKPESLTKKEVEDAITASTKALEKENAQLLKNASQREKDKRDAIFASQQIEDAFVSLGNTLGIQEQTTRDLFDGIKNGFLDAGEAAEAFGALAVDALNALTAAQRNQMEQRIEQLEAQRDVEIEFAGESAAARGAIEERYRRKIAAEKTKQAKREKTAAIIQSIISTAVAVVNTLASTPYPANLAFAAIIGALGAAQVAIIASQPIPQFEKGVRNFEGGTAMINEKRQEVVTTPDGGVHKPKGKNLLVNLPKGSDVYKSEADFQRSLNTHLESNGIAYLPTPKEHSLTASDVEMAMRRAIGSSGDNVLTIDKNGFTSYIQKGLTRTELMGNRVKFKGKKV